MTSYSAGEAYLEIVPSLQGFASRLKREMAGIQTRVEIPVDLRLDRRGLAALRDVSRTLPTIVLDADASPADREIAEVKAHLDELSGKTIGVDITAAQARREIDDIGSRLGALSRDSASIQVRVDAAAAEAALAAVEHEATRLDGRRIQARVIIDVGQALISVAQVALAVNALANHQYSFRVDADTSGAVLSLSALAAKVATLGALGGVIGGFGGAVAGLGAAGAVAASGLGATIIASLGVGKAISALSAQQDSAAQTGQQAAKQAQQQAYAIASAQDRLAQAVQSASRARRDAERSVADAKKAAAASIASAVKQEEQAQKSLRSANQELTRAQNDLTGAWEAGRRSLEDLQLQVNGNALDQKEAAFALKDAKDQLDAATESGNQDAIDRATVAYQRQQEQIKELQIQGQRLTADNTAAQAKGVAGTDQVVSANDRLAAAQDRVDTAQQAANDASAALDQARIDGADKVERAQEAANERIADSTHAVEEAQRALTQQLAQTGDAGQSAADKVSSAFADLGPGAAAFARFLFGAKDQLKALSAVAGNEFFPPLQAGLKAILDQQPAISGMVSTLAGATGGALRTILTTLANPTWMSFWATLSNASTTVLPMLASLFLAGADTARVLLTAFLPLIPAGVGLATQFLALLQLLSPFIAQLLGGLIPAAQAFLSALIPLGPVLAALQPILLVLGQAFATVLLAVLQALAPILIALTPLIQYLANALATYLVGAIARATPFLTGLAQWLSANPGLVLGVIKVLAALALGFKPLLFVLGIAATALQGFLIRALALKALTALGVEGTLFGRAIMFILSPLKLVSGALGLVRAIIGRLFSPMQLITAAARGLIGGILGIGRAILTALGPMGVILSVLTLLYTSNSQFRDAVNGVLTVLGQLVGQLVTALMPAFNSVMAAIQPLLGVFTGALVPILGVLAQVLVQLIQAVLPPLVTILQTVVIPIIVTLANILAAVLVWTITNIVMPAIQLLAGFIRDVVGPVLLWLWSNVVQPVFKGIGDFTVFIWQNVVKPVFDGFVWFLKNILFPVLLFLWTNVVQPVFRGIGDVISWVWQNVVKPTFDAVGGGLDALKQGFTTAVNWVRDAWNLLRGFLAKPINFFIGTVFNDGIRKAWNFVAGILPGVNPIDPLPLIPEARTGGLLQGPGTGTSDSILGISPKTGGATAWVSTDEFVVNAAVTEKVLPFLWSLNAGNPAALAAAGAQSAPGAGRAGSAGSVVKLATGGTVPATGSTGGGLFGFLLDQVRSGYNTITDPLIGVIQSFMGNPPPAYRTVPPALATSVRDKTRDFLFGKAQAADAAAAASAAAVGPSGPAGAGVQQWAGLVAQALGMVGQPQTLVQTVLRRMQQESGGNARAINLWDSNAKKGIPSKGLMQVIDPTFARYRDPRAPNDIYNPLANVLASMHYAIARYGSLAAAYNKAGGYDQGGIARGIGLLAKKTPLDEQVLDPAETQSYATLTQLVQQLEGDRFTPPSSGVTPGALAAAVAVADRAPETDSTDEHHLHLHGVDFDQDRAFDEWQRRRDFARRTGG